jgi:hypothetical protein
MIVANIAICSGFIFTLTIYGRVVDGVVGLLTCWLDCAQEVKIPDDAIVRLKMAMRGMRDMMLISFNIQKLEQGLKIARRLLV